MVKGEYQHAIARTLYHYEDNRADTFSLSTECVHIKTGKALGFKHPSEKTDL